MKITELNINEIYRVFDLLNEKLFAKKLEVPVILIQSRRKNILGTCSVNRIWTNKNSKKAKKNYEITLSAENLDRPVGEIVETLLHEMVHLYCSLNDIKDTSNNHVYHNKRYKLEAENHGLTVEYAQTIGWSNTSLKEETRKLIATFKINEKLFEYYRNVPQLSKVVKEKKKRNKYKCPCDITITSTKELNIICGDCKHPFVKVDK